MRDFLIRAKTWLFKPVPLTIADQLGISCLLVLFVVELVCVLLVFYTENFK